MSRRPVHKRDKNRTIKLQDRDLEILKALYYYRMLTTTQIYKLFFWSLKTAQVRMRKLFDAKLAGRIFRPTVFGTDEFIYILARGASELVSKETGVEEEKIVQVIKNAQKRKTFDHFLEVNDFRVALNKADTKREIFNWHYDDELRNVKGFRLVADHVPDPEKAGNILTLAPDGFFGIKTEKGSLLRYLEIDRGTMSNRMFYDKLKAYMSYARIGGFRDKWKEFGYEYFKVLIVCAPKGTTGKKDVEDRINTASKIDTKYQGMFMFTENTLITPEEILTPIWVSSDNLTSRYLYE